MHLLWQRLSRRQSRDAARRGLARRAPGCSSIAPIIVGTCTMIVGRCRSIRSKSRSGVARSGNTMPAAPTPNVKSVSRLARSRRRASARGAPRRPHGSRDIPGEALERDERVVREMTDRLRRAGAAGRELPERNVVLARRRPRRARRDRASPRDRLVEGLAPTTRMCGGKRSPSAGLADARYVVSSTTTTRGTRVAQGSTRSPLAGGTCRPPRRRRRSSAPRTRRRRTPARRRARAGPDPPAARRARGERCRHGSSARDSSAYVTGSSQ